MTVQDDPRDCREALKHRATKEREKLSKLHLTPGELRKLSVINDEDISVSKKTGKKAYYHTRTNQYQEEVA